MRFEPANTKSLQYLCRYKILTLKHRLVDLSVSEVFARVQIHSEEEAQFEREL